MGCGASLEDGGDGYCEAYTKWYELPAAAASSQWPAAPRKVFRGFTTAEDYELRFRFILRGTIGGWGSVVHFTASGDDSHWLPYGQRIPRIFVAPNSQKLCVVAGHGGNWNYHKYTRDLEIGAPVDVRVRLSGSTYEVFFGDQRVLGPSVHGARPSRSVSVYLGGMRNVGYPDTANAEICAVQYVNLRSGQTYAFSPNEFYHLRAFEGEGEALRVASSMSATPDKDLYLAAERGDFLAAKRAIEAGANVNYNDNQVRSCSCVPMEPGLTARSCSSACRLSRSGATARSTWHAIAERNTNTVSPEPR